MEEMHTLLYLFKSICPSMQNSLPFTNHTATFFIKPLPPSPLALSLDTPDNQFKCNFECSALYSFVFLEDIFFKSMQGEEHALQQKQSYFP